MGEHREAAGVIHVTGVKRYRYFRHRCDNCHLNTKLLYLNAHLLLFCINTAVYCYLYIFSLFNYSLNRRQNEADFALISN